MKRKYLLALVLAGALIFGNAPITANAASPNAGGAIVGGQAADAGDALTIGDAGTPLAAPAAGAADAGDALDEGDDEAPLVADAGDAGDELDIDDENAPLARLKGLLRMSRWTMMIRHWLFCRRKLRRGAGFPGGGSGLAC